MLQDTNTDIKHCRHTHYSLHPVELLTDLYDFNTQFNGEGSLLVGDALVLSPLVTDSKVRLEVDSGLEVVATGISSVDDATVENGAV